MSGSVVVCSQGADAAGKSTAELLTLGRAVSHALSVDLDWLVLGSPPDDAQELAARYGASHVDSVEDPALGEAGAGPDRSVAALARYCAQSAPLVLLMSQTYDARLVAPRLAGRLGVGVVMNAVDIGLTESGQIEVTATAYGGDTRAAYVFRDARPCIVAVTPGAVDPTPLAEPAAVPPVRALTLEPGDVPERIVVLRRAAAEGPRLEDARVVVAGGRGLGTAEAFAPVERLAALLGGLPAASRAIVDDGWVGPSLQIGLTGKITRPELYIAVGISGASQHMAGCSAAKAIVGINQDGGAAIFRYARYGIVGDAGAVLAALIQAVEAGAVVVPREG